ncbi:TPA: sn-glycerol-3-phosphate ABC transporter ATP-binding protein UgpC [Klebsiella pneumoniae]|uniref:ABC transporter ATP-binding protein n=1 Tax=Klebsiella pneumoniae TaxID=573 RepID=UPI0006686D0D|nr:sn-glycerol-3-phosphate ABC transporter ATP-binding protein UgpC [Klebsiella pneumoniae]HCI9672672.1 sn-glycerol-3-phosphate ABC transporter ATP-binding protein UgpC [Klebsiella variicola]HBS7601977.1 sn-glycerol-3-phosphate ABC transporter ATP-binding protein UgpC [Klebsiella pneumoniae]HBU9863498.1 sn-glycerol-3-phosphate ABC transporter ATP-binding protein UgpC [Klebsiella pneumoniae]HBW5188499.1 sn-glycerol-3-phosphate ABC transporter ATP-binding protein UgpC [Klebsiella pneumoniae]HBW5
MSHLKLEKLSKSYGENAQVIKSLDLQVNSGEFIVIVGPSGCGKSTLLRMIAGLEDISSGSMFIDGTYVNDDTPSERGIGMVFQSYALYPHMSVYQNMAFGLELAGKSEKEIDDRVQNSAHILQLGPLLQRRPKDLSGGQRQRVAIGRAIAREPKLFLFDEPLSNLDAALRVQMRMEIANLHKRLRSTIIYVTHDQVEAMTLADRIVVLNKGHIEQVGTPLELYDHPGNAFVAQFIGSPKMNMIPAMLAQAGETQSLVQLDNGKQLLLPISTPQTAEGQSVNLGIRPEHILWGSMDDSHYRANVMFVEHMGNETYLYLDNGNASEPWVVRNAERSPISAGQDVGVSLPPEQCYLFDGDGNAFLRC